MGDAGTWAGVVVALLVGCAGVLLAERSRRAAKQANELAQAANRLAADAVRKAAEANGIAERANGLSEQANLIAEGSAAQQVENWHVDWEAHWDRDECVLSLVNRGTDPALKPSVTITADDLDRVQRFEGETPRGGELTFTLDEIRERRAKHDREIDAINRQGGVIFLSSYSLDAEVVVKWATPAGRSPSQTLQAQLS